MRPLVLIACLVLATLADAATVKLRKKDNGNIIDVEVVELQVDKISFRLPGGERVYTVDWDSLDSEWIRRNSPAVWNERELLLRPAQNRPEKKAEDPAADPFAKETPAADTRDLIRNLGISLNDPLRGIDPGSISGFCRENNLEESTFWRGYDEMRRSSGTLTEGKDKPGDSDKSSRGNRSSKDGGRDRQPWERDPAGQARENQLRAEMERNRGILTCVGYMRSLAEGGYKGRLAWQLLRHGGDDRKAITSRLRKYETLAAELAERADKPEAKRDALVLRKLLGDVATSFERISRENSTQEERLKSDCLALLNRLGSAR